MSAVDLVDVGKDFQGVPAVSGVSLSIQTGEFVALLGPSGCGKTTTLRMIAGFEVPTAGEVRIRGRTVSAPGCFVPPEARNVGMVFQNYALWPHMTVEANVGYALRLRGLPAAERRQRVGHVLDLVRLAGREGRFPHELSGGQQQRVALARALCMEPAVLLLDEPLSNLDAQLRKEMRVEVKALQRRLGVTVLYVTHDQEEALGLADRVAVMAGGVIHQVGSPEEVFEQPADRLVASFMGCTTLLPCEVAGPNRVRLLLGEETPCVACPLPPGVAGAGVLGLRPEDLRLAPDDPEALMGRVTFRVYRGGTFELRVRVGEHALPLVTTTPVGDGDVVRVALGRARFFPDRADGASGEASRTPRG